MRFTLGVIAWLVVGMSGLVSAQAQAPPVSRSLTMDEAVELAVTHSPRLAEALARATAAQSSVSALKALAYPSASVLSQYARQNNITEFLIPDGQGGSRVLYPNIANMFKARAELSVPIYSFGRVASNVAAAEADVNAANADRRAVEAQVRLDTMRAYWTLATARESARVLVESLARTDAWVADVKAREAAGVVPPNDVLSAQAQRARQYVRLLQARNEEAIAELDLARLVGVPAGSSLHIASPVDQALPRASEAAALPVDELLARALEQRAERAGLTARGEGLRQTAQATLANLRPYATALAWFEEAKPNTRYIPPVNEWRDSWMLDVRFVWPLFDSGRTKAQAATFVAQAGAFDARRAEFDGLVAIEVRQRILDVEFSRAAIQASADAIAAAAEAHRVVGERFRVGVATSAEVLDAQVALLEAELERTRLTAGLRLSEARLLHALGER